MIVPFAEVIKYIVGYEAASEPLVVDIQEGVEKLVKNYCNRDIEAHAYTELLNGTGDRHLMLNNYPINSVAVISSDLNFTNKSYGTPVTETNYIVDAKTGIIEYIWSNWSEGQRNYFASYNAGYSAAAMPEDIKSVIKEVIAAKFYSVDEKRIGITNTTAQGETVTYTFEDFNKEQRKVLDFYRKPLGKRGIQVTGWGEES